jgi:PAS domain S-box-containing protein
MVIRFKAELKSAIVANPLLVSQEMTVLEAIAQMARARIIAMTDGFVASSTASSIAGYTGDMDYVHQEARSTCVLVMEHGQVIGIMTEREVVSFSAQFSHVISHVNPLANVTVGEVMRSPVIMYEDDFNDLSVVAKLLQQNHIRQIIVLDQGDRLLGIVTHESLMQLVRPLDVLLAQRELDLHHSEQRFISLAAAVPVGIFRTDIEGNCVYVNDRWCEISGLSIDEAAGFGWVNAIHPSDRQSVSEEWNASVRENRPFRLEYRFLNKSEQITWAYGQSVAEHDQADEIIGYVGTITDISDRKQSEQKLQQLNRELETKVEERTQSIAKYASEVEDLYNNAPCGYHSLDSEGIIVNINNTELQWLGYRREEILGKSLTEIITADCQQIFHNSFDDFKRRGLLQNRDYDLICKDGTILPVFLSATAVKDEEGNYLYSRSTLFDARDRKQAEQEILAKQHFIQKITDSSPNIL